MNIRRDISVSAIARVLRTGNEYSANELAIIFDCSVSRIKVDLRAGVEAGDFAVSGSNTSWSPLLYKLPPGAVIYSDGSVATRREPIQMTVPLTGDQAQKDRLRDLCLLTRRD